MNAIHDTGHSEPRWILVVLPTWVGDFVMATPTLRAIRNRFANAHISFLMNPNLRDLVRGGDWMDECIEWPQSRRLQLAQGPARRSYFALLRDLRARRFDRAILLSNSFRSALIVWAAGAKRRIGYERDGRGFLLTDRLPVKNRRSRATRRQQAANGAHRNDNDDPTGSTLPTEPLSWDHQGARAFAQAEACGSGPRTMDASESLSPYHPHRPVRLGESLPVPPGRFVPMPLVEYYADLAEAIGCDRPDDRLELFTTPDDEESVQDRLASLGLVDRRPLVVISPGARYGSAKCWAPERFASVADGLIDDEGAAVVITCGPGEESIARHIGSQMKRDGFVFDHPRLSLGELKALIRRSDLLICNDTGPRHFAKAFGVPVVTIFGPTHPEWTTTSYAAERIVRIDVDCGPCQQRVCPLGHLKCMTGVTAEAVLEAAVELLPARVGPDAP